MTIETRIGGDDAFGPLFLAETVHRLDLMCATTPGLNWSLDDDIRWSESVGLPEDAEAFAREAIFVIANSGMKHTIATKIFRKAMHALCDGRSVHEVFGHKGKASAMDTIWRDRQVLFQALMASDDRLAFCRSLPWIGEITKYHLAKNLGIDCAKPDVHLVRLAVHAGLSVEDLCRRLAEASGWRIATIDLILWRACAVEVLSSRAGAFMSGDRVAYSTFTDGLRSFYGAPHLDGAAA